MQRTPGPPAAPPRAHPTRFLVDAMLGNVARDLRLLGYDALYAGRRRDPELLRLCQSQGRVLITRDRALAARARPVRVLLVEAADPLAQSREVLERLAAQLPPAAPFSRCLACNALLRPLPPEEALHRVPDHVALAHRRFRECPGCGRVYWPGTHGRRLEERIRRLAEPLQPPAPQV